MIAHAEPAAATLSRSDAPSGSQCPLCAASEHRASWVGTVCYRERTFEFRACCRCRSIFCEPMPDAALLEQMYGADYGSAWTDHDTVADPRDVASVRDYLASVSPGTFVDYGCGNGALLVEAARAGWVAMGVELSEQVAASAATRTGCRVVAGAAVAELHGAADVVHLGDVVEHLTDVDRQMRDILALLKPGGLLLAQGPLEANANLFLWIVRLGRRLRGRPVRREPPYHVMLATLEGQEAFFRRFGLSRVAMRVSETAWPAPERLSMKDLMKPRQVALYAVRCASMRLSLLRPHRWGNRYFYTGRLERLSKRHRGSDPTANAGVA